ncbi:hypothetical protein GCM10010340_52050 [Streptomyces griseoloalbus]|nr:hypothetical protein GCM10010294_65600 [Streptomyces griseoloalbus]GGW67364.1 hypothetical protein GCM10010340_52050 [Streptomyces albaduncus]
MRVPPTDWLRSMLLMPIRVGGTTDSLPPRQRSAAYGQVARGGPEHDGAARTRHGPHALARRTGRGRRSTDDRAVCGTPAGVPAQDSPRGTHPCCRSTADTSGAS